MSRPFLLLGVAMMVAGTARAEPDHGKVRAGHALVCPPGLAKHNMACLPPGRFMKLFAVGQRVPYDFPGLTTYEGLPPKIRQRHATSLDPRSYYIFEYGVVYRINPETMVVTQVLQATAR